EPAPPGDAQRGAAVYEMSCGSGYCHGSDGISGPAPDHPETIPGLTDAELADIVQNGTGSMAPVGLSDTDLQDLVAYLRATFP
ncbi:MAG: Cytochrome oxidase, cbb3-type, subunit, partial [Pseudomonadota bacterium]